MLPGEAHSRRKAPDEMALELVPTAPAPISPCDDGCRHRDRCRTESLACVSLELFETAGRFSPYAPRQPSSAIYQRIQAPRPVRISAEERQRQREALVVRMAREF